MLEDLAERSSRTDAILGTFVETAPARAPSNQIWGPPSPALRERDVPRPRGGAPPLSSILVGVLSSVALVVEHSLFLSLTLGTGGVFALLDSRAGLTCKVSSNVSILHSTTLRVFISIFSRFIQESNIGFLQHVLVDRRDYDESIFTPPVLLREGEVWPRIARNIPFSSPFKDATSRLMSGAPAPCFPQPVGQPRKDFSWNKMTGVWDPVASTDAEKARARKNRPVGAPPKGKARDAETGTWADKTLIETKTEGPGRSFGGKRKFRFFWFITWSWFLCVSAPEEGQVCISQGALRRLRCM